MEARKRKPYRPGSPRLATVADIEPLLELLSEALAAPRGWRRWPLRLLRMLMAAELRGAVALPARELWLLEAAPGRAPLAAAQLCWDRRRSEAWLSNLVVRREQRRRGHGRTLMVLMEHRCAALGINGLCLRVRRQAVDARCFYRVLGFEPMRGSGNGRLLTLTKTIRIRDGKDA
ncbi:MAG: GNAT family N-acetyltransferase [Aphanocapsa feldmannii 288cV]|nr:MAG: GNAT family N-acetyltransferase [Aphanocapsa feldmannii 288cV]